MSEWVDAAQVSAGCLVYDAMGVEVHGVIRAKETETGVRAVVRLFTDDVPLLGSVDGVEFDNVTAEIEIPGGMLADLRDEELSNG